MTCLTCKWRAAMPNDQPEAGNQLYRCTRFPHHAILPVERVDSHTCGEYHTMPIETVLRFALTRATMTQDRRDG